MIDVFITIKIGKRGGAEQQWLRWELNSGPEMKQETVYTLCMTLQWITVFLWFRNGMSSACKYFLTSQYGLLR